jgi:hypothetical protein
VAGEKPRRFFSPPLPAPRKSASLAAAGGHKISRPIRLPANRSIRAGGVVWVETHITQASCAYPITSSTTMGAGYQAEVANGKQNLWGDTLLFVQPESEHSAASTCEGFALAGGRVTNFTSGQGLVLMKEVLYTIAGKHQPVAERPLRP